MKTEYVGMKGWMKTAAAVSMVIAVGGMVKVYGLEDVVFFNKGIISFGTFVLGFCEAQRSWKDYHRDQRRFAISYLMTLGLVFTELLGTAMRLEETKGGVNLGTSGVLFMIGAALVLSFMAEPLLYKVIGYSVKAGPGCDDSRKLNRVFFVTWGVLFAGYLPCILAFYPGLYCYDMVWQWSQFDAWQFTTHHPLIHTLFGGSLIELGKILWGSYNSGLFLHSLVQTLFLCGSMAYGIRSLVKWKVNQAVVILTGAFFFLFPFFPVMGITTTKDTVFAGFFLITFVDMCHMVVERRFYQGQRLLLFMMCAVLMCLFRNNVIYGLTVMACCLVLTWVICKMRKRGGGFLLKAAGLTVVCILLSQGMFMALEKGLHAEKGSKAEMLSLPMQQMARSYVFHQDEFSKEDKEELLRFFDESWLLQYKYYVSDPVKVGMKMEEFELADFMKLWLRLGRKFPGEYVKSPLYNMMGLWYMGGDSSCYVEYDMSEPFDEEHSVEMESKLPWLKSYYSWFTDENLQRYLPGLSIFFYTSFYSWCVALAAGTLIAKRKYLYLILPLFLACYGFTLVFGPCIIIRYFLGIMLCIPILAVMVFASVSQEDGSIVHGPESDGIRSPAGSYERESEG